MANRTQYKTLDRLATDLRIKEITQESENGLFVELSPGYNFDGCSGFCEQTVSKLIQTARRIEAGNPE